MEDVLTDGVLRVKLSEVVVFELEVEEFWEGVTRIEAFCETFPGELIPPDGFVAPNFELIIGGWDFTGILWTVSLAGPAMDRVGLIGEFPIGSSREIFTGELLLSFRLWDNETELARKMFPDRRLFPIIMSSQLVE